MPHHLAAEVGVDAVRQVGGESVLQQGDHGLHNDEKSHEADDRPEQAQIPGADHHIDDLHDQDHETHLQHLLHKPADEDQQQLGPVGADHLPEPTEVETACALIVLAGFRRTDQHQLQRALAQVLQLGWGEPADAFRGVGQHQPARTRLFHQHEAIVELQECRSFQPMQVVAGGRERAHLEAQALQDLAQMQQGDAAEPRLTVAQHLLHRFPGEGEAIAVGEPLQADQCGAEAAFAPVAHAGNAQAVIREPQAGGGDGIRDGAGIARVLPLGFRRRPRAGAAAFGPGGADGQGFVQGIPADAEQAAAEG